MQDVENERPFVKADMTQLSENISDHPKSKGPTPTGKREYKEAILLFIKMLVTIFLCEAAIMALLYVAPPKKGWEIIADPFLLTILGTPILYWLLIRPVCLALEQRNRAVEVLWESENRYKAVIDNAQEGIVVVQDKMLKFVNPMVMTFLDYTKDELMSRPFIEFVHPDDQKKVMDIHIKRFKGEEVPPFYEFRIVDKQDQTKWLENNGILIDWKGGPATLNFLRDITERKKIEDALRESEDKYRSIFEMAANLITSVDTNGIIVDCNNRTGEVLGYEREEIIGQSMSKIIRPDYMDKAFESLNEIMTTGYSYNKEYKMVRKDGSLIDVSINSSGLKNESGQYVRTICIIDNITERKKTEQELKKHQYYLEKAQAIGKIGTWELDVGKNILVWTDENYQIFGIPKGVELTYEVFLNCVYPDDREYVDKKWKAALNKEYYDIEHRIVVDGGIKWVREKAELEFNDEGDCVRGIGFTQDITERKKAEEKLLEYQARLKSLASQLSVIEERERHRIATELHDQIGQSLVFSKIKLEELQRSTGSGEFTESLEEICRNIDRIIQDTRSLTFDLSYPILYELGFEAAVSEWLDDQISRNYHIKTEFEDDGQSKPLDDDIRALLFRNVRELLVNVVKHANAQKVKVSVSKVDSRICVSVEDDGVGLKSAEAISFAGGNSGFGIFSIRERLEQLGGRLEIDSEEGQGSKITMTAPLKLTELQR